MVPDELQIQVAMAASVDDRLRAEIIALCDRAYGESLEAYLQALANPTHLIGWVGGRVVCHALWVTRWLRVGSAPAMRTAYVELVATDPAHQGRGYATAVMERLAAEISDYEIGALCPSDAGQAFYPRLGWEYWRGPLSIRRDHELIPTPDERVMVLRLPETPALDLDAPLSAEWREGELW